MLALKKPKIDSANSVYYTTHSRTAPQEGHGSRLGQPLSSGTSLEPWPFGDDTQRCGHVVSLFLGLA